MKIKILFIVLFLCVNICYALPYDYSNPDFYIIKLSPLYEISSKDNLINGQKIPFIVCEDIYVGKNKILSKNDIVNARIEMITNPYRNGIPAGIVIDNFEIPNVKQSQLISEYTKRGRSIWWLSLIKCAFPPAKFASPVFIFVKGTHAKLKTTDVVKIKYFPEWK